MNEKLTLQDLVDLLAQKAKISKKEADAFFKELFAIITENVYENEPVKIKDFGVFKLTPVSSRESVNVNTGEKIEIPAHYRLSFQADKTLKELVNKPFASFETILLDGEDGVTPPPATEVVIPKIPEVKPPVIEDVVLDDSDEDDHDIDNVSDVRDSKEEASVEVPRKVEVAKKVDTVHPKVEVKALEKEQIIEKTPESVEALYSQTTDNLSVSPRYVYSYTTSQKTSLGKGLALSREDSLSKVDKFEDFEKSVTQAKVEEELPVLEVLVEESQIPPVLTPITETVPLADDKEVEVEENVNLAPVGTPVIPDDLAARGLLPDHEDEDDYEDEDEDSEIDIEEDVDYDKLPDFYSEKPSLGARIMKKIPVILFVLIALAIIGYAFMSLFDVKYGYENFLNKTNFTAADTFPAGKEGVTPYVTLDSVMDETTKKLDSLKSEQEGATPIVDPYVTSKGVDIQNVNKAEEKYKARQDVAPEKIGSEVLKSGLTLRNLAAKYYGQSVFWVYIYEENKNVISDPDNIAAGVKVDIPNPSKYEIDAKNPASMNEAKQLELQIIRDARQKRFGGSRSGN